jgi:HD-GYP domain-containing protein (c-di-GMP phosphodiesterase class II)
MKQVIHFKSNSITSSNQKIINQLVEYLDLDLTEISDLSKLKSLINLLPELDFIIACSNDENTKELESVEQVLIDSNCEKHLIIIGNYSRKRNLSIVFNGVLDFEKIKNFINEIIFQNKVNAEKNNLNTFVPIKFSLIEEFKTTAFPVDFYLRIKQNAEDFQFVKKLLKNELFSQEDIEKFKKFRLEFLYVTKEQYSDFLKFAVNLAFSSNVNNEKVNLKDLDYSYHLAAKSLFLMGITEENINLVKQNIEIMDKAISKEGALAEYFKLINSNQMSYNYAHSYLISIFMSKVAQAFTWDSKSIREKIIYIAYFHDISLPNEHLAKIHSQDDILSINKSKAEGLSDREIEKINYHAINSSLILDQFPEVPIGVSQIVKEHHGEKNGIGFNENMNITLQPLSILFVVVEDFVSKFLDMKNPSIDDIKSMLQKLKTKYNQGNYKKSVEAIEKYLFSLSS